MNKEEIKAILPHREPMLLVEEAYLNEDGSATAYYDVRGDEFFLQGHFPGNPVVPGVILCEMMAQSCAVCLAEEKAAETYYTSLNNVRFRQPVKPGDRIRCHCRITKARKPFYFAEGKVYVGNKLCAQAEFSFMLA